MGWLSRKQRAVSVRHPLAKAADLLVEEFGDELLIYDQRGDRAHCLTSTASRVWEACDGSTSVRQLGLALNLDAATVVRALEQLEACGLLDSGPAAGVTRREATAKLVSIGAAAASAPLIYSITAPAPALAASQAFCEAIACPAGSATCTGAGCLFCLGSGCAAGQNSGRACVAACNTGRCTTTLANNKCRRTNGSLNTCTGIASCG
jgi:DNA-binding transcriptional regulator YhcF (GntR family)